MLPGSELRALEPQAAANFDADRWFVPGGFLPVTGFHPLQIGLALSEVLHYLADFAGILLLLEGSCEGSAD